MERVEPSELLAALDPAVPVEAACVEAIESGAAVFAPPRGMTVTPRHVLPIYRRRIDHLARLQARTVGGADFVRRLEAAPPDAPLSIALVKGIEFNFFVFMEEGQTSLACFAVDRTLENPEFNWETDAV